MRKQWILAVILVIAGFTAGAQKAGQTQVSKDTLPYLKYPTLPAFQLLMLDSSTVFNTYNIPKGKPTVMVYFSPDCEHCQKMTKLMLSQMDSMKEDNFLFFTPMPLGMLRPFYNDMHMSRYKNITAGKDYQYFFGAFYGARYVPYVVIYDRKKKFVKLYEGSVKMPELQALLRSL